MRTHMAVIASCAIACSLSLQATAECDPEVKKEISEVRSSWVTNWNAKQLDNVVNLYATDAVLLPPDGSRATGKTEIKASLEKQIGSKVSVRGVTVDCSGEVAYDSGSYTQDVPFGTSLTLTGVGGSGIKHIEGQYLVVLKHESGGISMGPGVSTGPGVAQGGGSKWLIVQHASTAKP
jgi:ketosteroid isomerase-like protein